MRREWLATEIDDLLQEPDCRFVLLTAEPGAGKSAFLAQLAYDHPAWPVYFIRRDQHSPLSDVGTHSFLLRLGYQLAAHHPALFKPEQIRVTVEQRIGTIETGGEAIGAEIERILVSPFYQQVVQIQQDIERLQGKVTGLRVGEYVLEPRLVPVADLQYMALIDPARALFKLDPSQQIVILVDALDEIRYHQATDNLLTWLTNAPELPPNVRFVLTSRPPDGAVSTFQDKQTSWVRPFELQESDGRVQQDLESYLKQLLVIDAVAEIMTTDEEAKNFPDRALHRADGNIGYLDALGRGIDQAVKGMGDATHPTRVKTHQNALLEILTLKELPEHLEGLYGFFLRQIQTEAANDAVLVGKDAETGKALYRSAWAEIYRPILGVLSVAFEPLSLEQITDLGGIAVDYGDLAEAKGRLTQFLESEGERYRLYHATVGEFLTASKTRGTHPKCYLNPTEWHRKIPAHYQGKTTTWADVDWGQVDDYGLRQVSNHLAESSLGEHRELLCTPEYMEAKARRLGTHLLLGDFSPYSSVDQQEYVALSRLEKALSRETHLSTDIQNGEVKLLQQLVMQLYRLGDIELCRKIENTLTTQEGSFFSPGWIGAASLDNESQLFTLAASGLGVKSLALASDGLILAAALSNGCVDIWNIESRDKIRTVKTGLRGYALGIVISPGNDLLFTGGATDSRKGEIDVWSLADGSFIQKFECNDEIASLAITPDGSMLISGSMNGLLQVWDPKTGELLNEKGVDKWVTNLHVIDSGKRLVSLCIDRKVIVWTLPGLVRPKIFYGAKSYRDSDLANRTEALAVSPNGLIALIGYNDYMIHKLDLSQRADVGLLKGHRGWVDTLAFIDNDTAISGASDKSLRVWDIATRKTKRIMGGHSDRIRSVVVNNNHRTAFSASDDGTIRAWDLATLKTSDATLGHEAAVTQVTVEPNSSLAVSTGKDGSVKIWDMEAGHLLRTVYISNPGGLNNILTLNGCEKVMSHHYGNAPCVWNIWTGEREFPASPESCESSVHLRDTATDPTFISKLENTLVSDHIHLLASTFDGRVAASCDSDEKIVVWDIPNGEARHTIVAGSNLQSLVFSPDGKRLYSGASDGSIKLWDPIKGELQRILGGSERTASTLTFSDDGAYVLSGSEDSIITVWDHANHSVIAKFCTNSNVITALTMFSKSQVVVSGSSGGILSFWDLHTKTRLATWSGASPITCLAIGPNSRVLFGDKAGNVASVDFRHG
ncbi:WD40 repeat domain-containing protein [Candidatus Nitrospira allomarina]|uniref:WD40 repeat domain-containing protein n=1 Tax=Candidatus Nitrospira allomarina TaxID=3020900 RepID=A0AA96GEJ8_9BACT|nr:WD40 repeat domain-containing protein [Candidatus Nitrospira allomarina]WNM59732.1 WD40 repeat domain-containing protein [Candidatus Nitrospira allomarina]